MKSYIANSLKLIEMQAVNKNVKIRTNLSDRVETITIDPDKMSQVLLNLYLNAIEAMDNGGELTVSVKTSKETELLTIEIKDTGIGIHSENLNHIFDPYFTTKSSGTGLGLAISYNIIEAHNGKIHIESDSSKGTIITIHLPLLINKNE